MSTNRLSHLKEGEKIYLEVEKVTTKWDDEKSMCFETNCINSVWVNDDDIFYFPDELKALANDGMPKQGDEVQVEVEGLWLDRHFIAFYKGKIITDNYINHSNNIAVHAYTNWRYPPKKTELTLAEVEEKLGLDAGSLIIK